MDLDLDLLPGLFEARPIVDVRREGPTGETLPPNRGTSPATRHTSMSGAVAALPRVQSQANRMLVRYLRFGPQSDGDQALALGLPEGRISARRSMLMEKGLVVFVDIIDGPHRAKVTRYELSVKGQNLAAKIAELNR